MNRYQKLAIILSLGLSLIGCGGLETQDIDSLPVALDDTATVTENGAAIGILVLSNDTPIGELNVSSVEIITPPQHGSYSVINTGEVKYKPGLNYHGTDSLVYTVKDTDGNFSNPATVTINVTSGVVPFKIKVLISSLGPTASQFVIPTRGAGYNYNIDCNDDGNDEFTGVIGSEACNYSSLGEKIISISGTFPQIYFAGAQEQTRLKLISVEQWGTGVWRSMLGAFAGCRNLQSVSSIDIPDLSMVLNMNTTFADTPVFIGNNISNWDVSNVTSMRGLFFGASTFNQNLNSWVVDNVTDMNSMFRDATLFNGEINLWKVGKVTDMSYMFSSAKSFNQNIGDWIPEKVTDMSFMFRGASSFNQDIGDWTVGLVNNMYHMFNGAEVFNQNIKLWDVSSVTHMGFMFSNTKNFNQDIGTWTITNVEFMFAMFAHTENFNGDISGWGASMGKVKNMASMFTFSKSFNQDLSNWDVSNVDDMGHMFREAAAFNQDLTGWSVGMVTDMSLMFFKAISFTNHDLSGWDVPNITTHDNFLTGAGSGNTEPTWP